MWRGRSRRAPGIHGGAGRNGATIVRSLVNQAAGEAKVHHNVTKCYIMTKERQTVWELWKGCICTR